MGAGKGGRVLVAAWLLVTACGDTQTRPALASLQLSEEGLDWGLVAIGDASPRTLTLRNAGIASMQIRAVEVPAPFAVRELPAGGFALEGGEERAFQLVFAPTAAGTVAASATIDADDAPQPRALALRGEGVAMAVAVEPAALGFGPVALGAASARPLTVRNDSRLPVQVALAFSGPDADAFGALDAGASFEVAAGGTRAVPVEFHPRHLGSAEAAVTLTSCAACAPLSVSLSGEGLASCIDLAPQALDLGAVEVGASATAQVVVSNPGTTPVTVTEVFLASTSSADFAFTGFVPSAPRTLLPKSTLPLQVQFTPSAHGPRAAALRVRATTAAGEGCWAELRAKGTGGSGCLVASPAAVDFGLVPVGMGGQRRVTVGNAACGADVLLQSVEVRGDSAFTAGTTRPPPITLRQGESVEVVVRYNPAAPGAFSGALHLEATDLQGRPLAEPPSDVTLRGDSRGLAPCEFEVLPARLDFGLVSVGRAATLAFRLRNSGADSCFFSNLQLSANSAEPFSLDGGSPGFILESGRWHDARVTFAPSAPGSFAAALETYVSDPANPFRTWPIVAQADTGCLTLEPTDLDFGAVAIGCPTRVRSTSLVNRCAGEAHLNSVVKGAGTSQEFSLPSLPPLPATISPGASLTLQIEYRPLDDGLDSMPLFLDDGTARRLVSLRGVGLKDPWRVDAFDQSSQEKVDVLFVLDNSGSMSDKQAAVGANLGAFLRSAQAQGVDYRIAVTTTGVETSTGGWTACPGGADGGEAGRLYPVDNSGPRILTPGTASPEAVWAKMTAVGTCHWLEQGLEASRRALTPPLVDQADDPRTTLPADGNLGFYRPEAKLSVIFVSDEEDQSTATVDYYEAFFRSLKKDPSQLSLAAVVTPADVASCANGTSAGLRYTDLVERFAGVVESVCTPDWSASLGRIGSDAFGLQAAFPLSARPEDAGQIVVTVNGAEVPDGGNWFYDAGHNAIVFYPGSEPSAGSHIEVRYPIGCI